MIPHYSYHYEEVMENNEVFEIQNFTLELNTLDPINSKTHNYFQASLQLLVDFLSQNVLDKKMNAQFELSVHECDEDKICQLNQQYRGKNKKTDVLSFPIHENLRANSIKESGDIIHLGDIYICKEVALEQSSRFELSYEEEFIHLFFHGFLHLCGFDHELSPSEEKLMQKHETQLLKSLALLVSKNQ